MDEHKFSLLSSYSATLHGHKYVFPVAVWLLEHHDAGAVTQPEIRKDLVHAESNRILEALARLTALDAVVELPKTGGRRFFELRASPYWDFVSEAAKIIETKASTES